MYPMRKPAWKPSVINFAKALSGYISRYANKASRLTGDRYFGQLAVVVELGGCESWVRSVVYL